MEEEHDVGGRIDARLQREPVVLVSSFDRWHRWALIGLLVIDLVLTAWLLTLIEGNSTDINDIQDLVNQAKAIDCRSLLLDGGTLAADGACFDPDVLEYYDPQTGKSR